MDPSTLGAAADDAVSLLRSLPVWASVPLLLATALAIAKALDLAAERVVARAVARSESAYDDVLLEELHRPLVVTVVVVGVLLSGVVLPDPPRSAVEPYLGAPALSALVLLWAWTANRVGNRLLAAVGETDGPYAAFAPVFSNLLTFALAVGGLFGLLALWEVDVTPLLASAGIAGVAVGFAAKDTVANFFGGLALYVDRTYRIGDFVTLDSGERGTVVKVGIRSTTVLTRDEVLVTVPNARIVNETAPKRRKRIRVPVAVAYGTDVDLLESVLAEAAAAEDLVLDRPEPRVRFLRFGDSALEYEVRCWVPGPTRETKARHELNRALYRRFGEEGIEVPYPQRVVTLRGASAEAAAPRAAPAHDGVDVDAGPDAETGTDAP